MSSQSAGVSEGALFHAKRSHCLSSFGVLGLDLCMFSRQREVRWSLGGSHHVSLPAVRLLL